MSEGFDLVAAFEEFFALALGEERAVVSFRERRGKQGASGSSIRYFEVQTESAGKGRRSDKLVVKDAGALERLVVSLLKGQGCAVPPAWIGPEFGGRGPVMMPFLEEFDERGMRPSPRLAADALTGIHVANLGLPPYWLPAVQADPKGLLSLTTRAKTSGSRPWPTRTSRASSTGTPVASPVRCSGFSGRSSILQPKATR